MANPWEMEWEEQAQPVSSAQESPPWEQEWEPAAEAAEEDPIETTFADLGTFEGKHGGDTLTGMPTDAYGVTESARRAVKASPSDDPEKVARKYLSHLNKQLVAFKGYTEAPSEVKSALLDLAYNLGEDKVKDFGKMKKALEQGNYEEALKETLDSPNVEKMSVIGIAKRRAHNYNRVADRKIAEIVQYEDGSIFYYDDEDNTVFNYTPKGGRHPKSTTDRVKL